MTIVSGRNHRKEGILALGKALWSPQRSKGGSDIYRNMRAIGVGDVVVHLIDNREIVGASQAAAVVDDSFKVPARTEWDDGTGERPGYLVRLTGFVRFENPIGKGEVFSADNEDGLLEILGNSPYPLFYNRDLVLQQGRYVTEVPRELVQIIGDVFQAKEGKDMPYVTEEKSQDNESDIYSLLESKRQIVLYGPPGTGKTFKARVIACGLLEMN